MSLEHLLIFLYNLLILNTTTLFHPKKKLYSLYFYSIYLFNQNNLAKKITSN